MTSTFFVTLSSIYVHCYYGLCCLGVLSIASPKTTAPVFRAHYLHFLLGGSGVFGNSLDFYPASLKFLGRFYFRCLLSSQWKAVTVN